MSQRTFTISNVVGTDGCATKFKIKGDGGHYRHSHASAARKACNQLCKLKNIKGQCAMIITVRETTQGSDKKELTYKVNRIKLKTPVILPGRPPMEYDTKVYSYKGTIPGCSKGLKKSPGPMRSKRSSHGKSSSAKTKKATKL